MATDTAAGELVLIGERSLRLAKDGNVSWQTWTWRGGNWVLLPQALSPQGPHAQTCEMTYDAAHQNLVLVTASWSPESPAAHHQAKRGPSTAPRGRSEKR